MTMSAIGVAFGIAGAGQSTPTQRDFLLSLPLPRPQLMARANVHLTALAFISKGVCRKCSDRLGLALGWRRVLRQPLCRRCRERRHRLPLHRSGTESPLDVDICAGTNDYADVIADAGAETYVDLCADGATIAAPSSNSTSTSTHAPDSTPTRTPTQRLTNTPTLAPTQAP